MAGTGAGYDFSVSTFSPDGRVFQVEYASKAVDNSPLCLGVVCSDGVAFAVEKAKPSPTLVRGSSRRIHPVTSNVGMVIAGLIPDGRQLWHRALDEASNYRKGFGVDIPAGVLAERIALYMHAYSLYWYVRPFGNSVLIGAMAGQGGGNSRVFKGEIYCVDPSGCCSRYLGTALGKGRPSAKTEIEKLQLKTITCREVVPQLIKIFLTIDEDTGVDLKKKEMEVSVIEEQNGSVCYRTYTEEETEVAIGIAKDAVEAMDS